MHFGHLNVNSLPSKKEELRTLAFNTYISVSSPSLKNNFQVITFKKSFLAVVIAPVSFVLISYSLRTQVMLILTLIDIQYSQKAVFSFKKFEWSKSLLLRFPPPNKKLSPSNKISDPFPHGEGNFPPPLSTIWKILVLNFMEKYWMSLNK